MDITYTDLACEVLERDFDQSDLLIRLDYDTEGCGCVNDGVIHLKQIASPTEGDQAINSSHYPTYIPSAFQVYYNEHLTVDYSPHYKTFQLKSHQRMINPRMRVIPING
ncbi:iron-sulfur cluster biosynthesis family protein [Pullulanibacillus sp. KACC 23026]|uniref:iron-sulfur cluster biosynthesis family protein n=1 Tax=Pullulanibacillus sp. KACC 23026 TaxID=3028315 RepID=UPI0023B155B5|nr:iron-sulfur cluster biosynthesis family protein [Pullulanibacillus sp. KACC 23026]WEG11468.1 iron-sulfur cluster biosynthesis family protein [Pullulanibacillus sp. KACC 23026]